MHEIALFVEDFAHRQIIGALVQRIAGDFNLDVRLDGRMVSAVKSFQAPRRSIGNEPNLGRWTT